MEYIAAAHHPDGTARDFYAEIAHSNSVFFTLVSRLDTKCLESAGPSGFRQNGNNPAPQESGTGLLARSECAARES